MVGTLILFARFKELRKQFILERVKNPAKKTRHTKVDHKDLVRRSEEDYVDFQEAWKMVCSYMPGHTSNTTFPCEHLWLTLTLAK